jgi:hypothetical protein
MRCKWLTAYTEIVKHKDGRCPVAERRQIEAVNLEGFAIASSAGCQNWGKLY